MAEDPLNDIIAAVRTRLQDELETQLRSVSERHQQALAETRQQIEAEHHEELTRLRVEAERQLADETARLENEADQRAADAAARVRQELEQALLAERQQAQSRVDAERRSAAEQLEDAREAFDSERRQWEVHAAAGTHARSTAPLQADSLVRGLREIEAATSVSESLAAIARAAAAEAPRASLFIANGDQLDEWAVTGLPALSSGSLNIADPDAGIVVQALTSGQAVRNNGSACAVPLLLDGAAVGVLYGEADADGHGGTAWGDSLEAVARYGAAHLGYLTALRTAQARQWLGDGAAARQPNPDPEAIASARRYARLVVSEIKLYNEPGVQAGRTSRDLSRRLAPEIDRARRLYEERVPPSVAGREAYFQQELVQTLAGGDPALLG